MTDAERLALDAIKAALNIDLMDFNQNGLGNYEIPDELIDLGRRARALGLVVEAPFEGYSYLGQIT